MLVSTTSGVSKNPVSIPGDVNAQQVTLSDERSTSQSTQREEKSTCQDILGVFVGSHNGVAAVKFGKMSIHRKPLEV